MPIALNNIRVQSPWNEESASLLTFLDLMRISLGNTMPSLYSERSNTGDAIPMSTFKRYSELFYDNPPSGIPMPSAVRRLVENSTIPKWSWPFIYVDTTPAPFLLISGRGGFVGTCSTSRLDEFERYILSENITLAFLRKLSSHADSLCRRMFLAPLLFSGYVATNNNNAVTDWARFEAADGSPSNLRIQNTQAAYDNNDVSWEIEDTTFILRRRIMSKESLYELKSYSYNFFSAYKKRLSVDKKERDAPIYGVELELSTRYGVPELIDAVDTIWICAKQDSSITGKYSGKYEMVTLPATLKAHKQLWGKWFAGLDMAKFDQTRSTNNGMHVHVAKESFNDQRHQRDFAWFFTNPLCSEFMINFSERGRLNDYCRMPNWADHGYPSSVKTRKDINRYLSGLRGAINVGGTKPTIEVRLFKGIVSYATVLKNLELVDAVFHFTAKGVSYSCNPMREFFNWLRGTNKNQYEALKEYITKFINEEDYTLTSDVSLLIQKYGSKPEFLDKLNALHEDKLLLRDVLDQLKFRRKVTLDMKLNKLIWRDEKPSPRETNTGALMESDSKYLNRFVNKPKKVA